jgi:hypothetical protein
MNHIKLQNRITGKFYANGAWDATFTQAEIIEEDSPSHIVLRHTWDMTHTIAIPA